MPRDPTPRLTPPLDRFETIRLLAERLVPEHLPEVHRMHQDPVQMEYLGGIRDAAASAAYLARNLRHWEEHGFGLWLLRDRESGQVAGRALLRHLDVAGVDEVETGYSFHPVFWGRGLATETTRACLRIGHQALGLRSIVAVTHPANVASHRVLAKAGMFRDRELRLDGTPQLLYRSTPSHHPSS